MYTYEGYGVKIVREPQSDLLKPKVEYYIDAVEIIRRQLACEDREIFVVMLLDVKKQVLGINTVSIGTVSATFVHPREVFKPAIVMGASSIILAHNHPSGGMDASLEDIEQTQRLIEAGKLLGIEVLDDLIITETGFSSIKDQAKL